MAKRKKIVIAFDPGFDGAKVSINEKLITDIPFVVKRLFNGNEVNSFAIKQDGDNYILYEKNGARYVVGSFAKKMLQHRGKTSTDRGNLDAFYKLEGRFASDEFRAGFDAIVGWLLIKYEELTQNDEKPFRCAELSNYDISIGVALPHDKMDKIWSESVEPFLKGEHKFSLQVGAREMQYFDIKYSACQYCSQAYCALLNYVAELDGELRYDMESIAPATVILAGYKTLERFQFLQGGIISTGLDNNASNEQFAMFNVNSDVVNAIQEKYGSCQFTEYEIESFLANGKESVFMKNSAAEDAFEVPIAEFHEEALKKRCAEMLDDTKANFDLLDTKLILVAGGTGAKYYKFIKEWCDNRNYLKGKSVLETETVDGVEYGPVFAVVLGLQKQLMLEG